MPIVNEYKVRPVIRYIVTHYVRDTAEDGRSGSCGSAVVAECPNERTAEWVRDSMAKASEQNALELENIQSSLSDSPLMG